MLVCAECFVVHSTLIRCGGCGCCCRLLVCRVVVGVVVVAVVVVDDCLRDGLWTVYEKKYI